MLVPEEQTIFYTTANTTRRSEPSTGELTDSTKGTNVQ